MIFCVRMPNAGSSAERKWGSFLAQRTCLKNPGNWKAPRRSRRAGSRVICSSESPGHDRWPRSRTGNEPALELSVNASVGSATVSIPGPAQLAAVTDQRGFEVGEVALGGEPGTAPCGPQRSKCTLRSLRSARQQAEVARGEQHQCRGSWIGLGPDSAQLAQENASGHLTNSLAVRHGSRIPQAERPPANRASRS